MFNVYDTVWIMQNDKPTQKVVFAVVNSMDYNKTGVEVHLRLVNHQCGAGWGNNEGLLIAPVNVFTSKESLLKSLQ